MRQTQLLTASILCLTVVIGCSGQRVSRDEHISRGDRYLAEKKLPEAILEYRAATQADTRSGLAHQKLGEAYLQTNDPTRAFREFVLAADLMPDDVQAQLRAGQVLLLVRHFEDARGRADKVLAKDPRNIDAHILKGNALAGLKDFKEALEEIQRAVDTDPTRSAGYANLGALQFAQGDVDQAEASFKRALAADPKSPATRLALANLYWSSGRRKEAEAEVKEASKLDPTNVLPHQALAMLYLGSNRMAEAEAPLKAVAQHSPFFGPKIALADYYVHQQRLPEAKALYEQVAAAGGDGQAPAKLRLAALGMLQGDRPGAYRIVEEVLKKDPNHVEGLVARARLQFDDGKIAEGLADARKATMVAPSSAVAHFVLGQMLKSQHQTEDAEEAFKAAIRASPGFAPANAELARLALLAGKYADAARYAQAAIDRVPTYGEAYLLLARAQIASGNPAAAETPIKTMVTNFPDSPVVQAELGRLLMAKSDMAGAAAALQRALAKDPLQVAALETMVGLEVRQKRVDAARKRLDAAVAAAPKNGELQLMAARMYATALGDTTNAEKAIKRAIDADPNNLAAYDLLARLYVKSNNLPQATIEFEKLAQRQPKSIANHTAVGLLYHLQNRLDQAKAGYQRALALDPKAPVAANNLAQLYADRNEELDVALQLAQAAKAALPNAHEVDDTLGWVYYRKGLAPLAVTSLKAAVTAQPDNAVYLYHLGAAYALNNERINARQSLEKALKLQPNFQGAGDARKILDSLKN